MFLKSGSVFFSFLFFFAVVLSFFFWDATPTHLSAFALDADQVLPFLDGLGQVDHHQRHFDLADLIVLRETVKVVDGEHQRLGHGVGVRHLQKSTQCPLDSQCEDVFGRFNITAQYSRLNSS